MNTRQAKRWTISLLALLATLYACSPSNQPIPTPTPFLPTSAPTPTHLTDIITETPTATQMPLTCLSLPGRVDKGVLESTKPAQEFMIYLPPCYDEKTEDRYPVLYLLHGQTYIDDQWIRIGAVNVLDKLIHSGEAIPFIIVFPDDRYWNLEAGPGFGNRLVNALIPHVDGTYRTIPDRNHRAIGGMSRGAGWALELGLTRWDLFSIIGLHSLAVFEQDGSQIDDWLKKIPPLSYPIIFLDSGDNDPELAKTQLVESQFNNYGVAHEWHLFSGGHTEEYWQAHVEEYIRWYVSQWNEFPK